jgi:hypothetical protein
MFSVSFLILSETVHLFAQDKLCSSDKNPGVIDKNILVAK